MGLGAFPGDDPQFIGMLGMHGTYEANMTMHNADVILCVGARFDDRVTNNPAKFCPNAKVIHIDIDPAAISKTIMAHIPIVGAVEPVLTEMLAQLKQMNVSKPNPEAIADWWEQINEWRKVHGGRYEAGVDGVMKPQQVSGMIALEVFFSSLIGVWAYRKGGYLNKTLILYMGSAILLGSLIPYPNL